MAKRFSRYKFALKANGGATGGALKKYNDFILGNSDYVRTAPSGSSTIVERQLTPFALDLGTNFLLVGLTERALVRMTAVGLSETLLNLAPAEEEALEVKLIPAKISAAKAQAADSEISKITGVAYKKVTSDAFVAPFGAKTATEKYGARVKALKDAVESSNKKNSASFSPERIISK